MKLNELINTNDNIGTLFNEFFNELYIKLFNDIGPGLIDNYVSLKYSDCECYKKIANYELFKNFVLITIATNEKKWLANLDFYNKNIIFENVSRETKTGTIQNENVNENVNNNAVKAFNENEFNENTQNTTNENYNGTQTYNLTVEKTNTNFNINENILLKNFQMDIISDIMNNLILKVF